VAFQELVKSLEELLDLHISLHELALQKKEHIIHNKMDELNSVVLKETKLIKEVSNNEQLRQALVVQLQRDLGYRPRLNIKLTEVIKAVTNPDDKQTLIRLQSELSTAINNLRQLNELNQQLLMQSMDYVNFSLDAMLGAPDEEATYKKPSIQPQAVKRTGLFDTRW